MCICFFSSDGFIHECDVYYIKQLSKLFNVVLIGDCEIFKNEINKVNKYVYYAKFVRHKKYDFGSYFIGYKYLVDNNLIKPNVDLLLANNSVIGPLFDLKPMINKMNKEKCDFWGICRNELHLHSYFMYFKSQILKTKCLYDFLSNVVIEENYNDIIVKYEVGLSQYLLKNGFIFDSYIPQNIDYILTSQKFTKDPSKPRYPICLINDYHCPVVKKKVFREWHFSNDSPYEVLKLIKKTNPILCECILKEFYPGITTFST